MTELFRKRLSRRELLGIGGAAGTMAVIACSDDNKSSPTATNTRAATGTAGASNVATATQGPSTVSCVVSPQMTEGPYFVDEQLERSDIREDPSDGTVSEGAPLALTLGVQNVAGDGACTPVSGAHVDIWHCDAEGLYSDQQANGTVGRKFLRGYQLTDENGNVEFTTIYPGWYMGRTVHIHIKVRTDPGAQQGYEFTSQLFFDETVTNEVYASAPYNTRGEPDTPNSSDMILSDGGDQMLLPLTKSGDGYAGTLVIGVQTT